MLKLAIKGLTQVFYAHLKVRVGGTMNKQRDMRSFFELAR